jgi:hypothetical protein
MDTGIDDIILSFMSGVPARCGVAAPLLHPFHGCDAGGDAPPRTVVDSEIGRCTCG